jgi:hypothetical protein
MYRYRKGALMYNTTEREMDGGRDGAAGQVEADRQLELCSWVE